MALFNLGSAAPQYMAQAIFDEAVFKFYRLRHQYEDCLLYTSDAADD